MTDMKKKIEDLEQELEVARAVQKSNNVQKYLDIATPEEKGKLIIESFELRELDELIWARHGKIYDGIVEALATYEFYHIFSDKEKGEQDEYQD